MSNYKEIEYEKLPDGRWRLTFPSGLKTIAPEQTEEQLKAEIDSHHTAMTTEG